MVHLFRLPLEGKVLFCSPAIASMEPHHYGEIFLYKKEVRSGRAHFFSENQERKFMKNEKESVFRGYFEFIADTPNSL